MSLKTLWLKIKGDSTGLNSSLKQTEGSLDKFKSSVAKVGASIIAAFSIGAIVAFGKEIIGLASKAEGVKTAFDRLDNPALLGDLRAATRGTVDDITLMQKAVQAKNFKIPLDQLAGYFEFATNRAIQTGESVDYLVDSIITGIGRKSVLVMDNLGISAVELQEEVQRVGDFGAAAGVIIQRELEKAGDVADTTAIKMTKLSTTFQNFKAETGGRITGSKGFQSALDFVNDFTDILKQSEAGFGATLIATIFNRKELTEDVKALEKGIAEENKKQTAELQKQAALRVKRGENTPISNISGKITTDFGLGLPQPNELKDVALKSAVKYLDGWHEAFMQEQKENNMALMLTDILKSATQEMSQVVGDIVGDVFEALGSGSKDIGKDLLMNFANFLSNLGRMMIAYGVLNSAFYESLAAGPLGGGLAIAAGVAAIAAAGLIKGAISKAGSAMSGGSAGGGSYGGGSATSQTGLQTIKLVGTLKGTDIALAAQRSSTQIGGTT